MARSKLRACELHEQYGDVLAAAPLCDCPSAYLLHRALASRQPPVEVSLGAVTIWWGRYTSQMARRLRRAPKILSRCMAIAFDILDWSILQRTSYARPCGSGSSPYVSPTRPQRCGLRHMPGNASCSALRTPGTLRHCMASAFARTRLQTSLQMPYSDGFLKSTLFQCARGSARRF